MINQWVVTSGTGWKVDISMTVGGHVGTADGGGCLASHHFLSGKGSVEGDLAVADGPRWGLAVLKTAPLMEVLYLELRMLVSKSLPTGLYPDSLPG